MSSYEPIIVAAIRERLCLLADFDYTLSDPMDLVLNGLMDPVKLFVKNEPHKLSKLLEGRLRLIFSMSIIDNGIARLLFSSQNQSEIETWDSIPLKPGMGLTDEAMNKIYAYVKSAVGFELMEADMKGWDWSFQESDFKTDLERRIILAGARGTVWERIAKAHYYCVARKVVCLSDGRMFKQLTPGIMPSGWYNTSSTNSAVRAMNHAHAAIAEKIKPWIMAMGDDSVERFVPRLEYHYQTLGKTCGMLNKVTCEDFEFCSTRFSGGIGVPVNVSKQLYNLLAHIPLTLSDATQRFGQFSYELRNHPQLRELQAIVTRSGWWKGLLEV